MYHVSDLKRFNRCHRLYYYDPLHQISFIPRSRSDVSLGELLCRKLNIDIYFTGNVGDPNEAFLDNIPSFEWFLYPRLDLDGFRINVPVVHKLADGFDLYFLFRGTNQKELDMLNLSCCLQVFEEFGLQVNEIYMISFVPSYIREGDLDPNKLFTFSPYFKGKKIVDTVREKPANYKDLIAQMESYIPSDPVKKGSACHRESVCPFNYSCFPEEINMEDNSIMTLISSRNRKRMYRNGVRYLKDAQLALVEGNRIQYAQIMADRNGGLYLDRCALSLWMKPLEQRPISFIDFEWDCFLVPAYDGMKPLDDLCFEYALYTLDEAGEFKHSVYVGKHDCRKEFVESLLKDLPQNGPILAYNAAGAECLRIKELANIFPEYSSRLLAIAERFIDLSDPFIEGLVYDTRFRGNFTLKRIVSVISDYSYDRLAIHDGVQAVEYWRNYEKAEESTALGIKNDLSEYCSLDAYGLYLLYPWLKKL